MTLYKEEDLPFLVADVKARYPAATVVKTIRPHAISPNGKYVVGTCNVGQPASSSTIDMFARWFVIENSGYPGNPMWKLMPEDNLPAGWLGASARGVNDHCDIVGFYDNLGENPVVDPHHPFLKLAGTWAEKLFDPEAKGVAWGINARRIVVGSTGRLNSPYSTTNHGFQARPTDPVGFWPFTWDDPYPTAARLCINDIGDQIVQGTDGLTYAYLLGSLQEINISGDSFFPAPPTVNAINDLRQIVGFFASEDVAHGGSRGKPVIVGFMASVYPGGLSSFFEWVHPNAAKSTQIMGISNSGLMVGTYDAVNPFALYQPKRKRNPAVDYQRRRNPAADYQPPPPA